MSFVVTKFSPPELVLPWKPTLAGDVFLTSTDKRALSQALVYYPVTGGDGDIHTGEGVAFASATASCSLQDVRFLHAPPAIPLAELALCRLLMMHVTEFACGGYVVAVTWNHGVMQAVGELARGLPSPTVVPIRHDESLPDIPQLVSVIQRRAPAGFEFKHADFAYTDVTIPWSFINRVKGEFQSHAGSESEVRDKMPLTRSSSPALVVPSDPTPAGEIRLTTTDKAWLFVSFTSLQVFARPIHQPAETIRRALSHALVHYYPIAGRVAGDGDDAKLVCNGKGVAFVSATASCSLQDAGLLDVPLEKEISLIDLTPTYGSRCGLSDPLMMMQVTEFTCGGYVVGVAWNHGAIDGVGLAQFLTAVGEVTRGLPSPSIVPVRYDEFLPDIPQPLFAALRRPLGECNVAGGRSCTVFEVVTAAIWRCRIRAINAEPGTPAPLVFAANVRRHLGAKDGYYGNCFTSQLVTAASGAVATGAVSDVVKLISDAKERIPESLTSAGAEMATLDVRALCGYNALFVSTWGGIGMDAVDFGGGPAARLVPKRERTVVPSCFPCLPGQGTERNGAHAVAFCVTQEHVEEFRAQLASLC
ncbi:hypothetical protein HU200_013295 [Digitaria exilis]|uniref:Uncharacterized protein n=1 Tax=Digitaria exilis TaxID=1010633 RepID=A0A835FDC0_9POAL|nr:hypothetical protein HU200_013295 [Digitaria exilis]